MAGVQQPVEVAAAPARNEIQAHVQHGSDLPERFDRERVEVSAFSSRDARTRHARGVGHVRLPQAAPDANGAHGRADALIAHAAESRTCHVPAVYTALR